MLNHPGLLPLLVAGLKLPPETCTMAAGCLASFANVSHNSVRLLKSPALLQSLVEVAEAGDEGTSTLALETLTCFARSPRAFLTVWQVPGLMNMLVRVVSRGASSLRVGSAWTLLGTLAHDRSDVQFAMLRAPGLVQAALRAIHDQSGKHRGKAIWWVGLVAASAESQRALAETPGLIDAVMEGSLEEDVSGVCTLTLANLAQRTEVKLALVQRADFSRMLRFALGRTDSGLVLLLELLASPEVASVLSRDRELVSLVAGRGTAAGRHTSESAMAGTALALLMDFDAERGAKAKPGMAAWKMVEPMLWHLTHDQPGHPWRWENMLSCLKRVAEAEHCADIRFLLVNSPNYLKALLKRRLTQCLAYVVAGEPSRSGEGDARAARFAFLSVDVLGKLVEGGVVELDDVGRSLVASVLLVVVPRQETSLGFAENAAAWGDVRRRALAVAGRAS